MKTARIITLSVLALAALGHAQSPTLSRPSVSIEIAADPAKVWKKLLTPEGMAAFGAAADAKLKSMDKVGDHAHVTIGADAGNVVITHVTPGMEMRAAFEPDQGHYICSIRYTLKAQGKGTLLTYADWYSEEKPENAEKNLSESRKFMSEGLGRFKALVEKATAGN